MGTCLEVVDGEEGKVGLLASVSDEIHINLPKMTSETWPRDGKEEGGRLPRNGKDLARGQGKPRRLERGTIS